MKKNGQTTLQGTVAPLTDHISCHICLAKSVGLTSFLGLIVSFISLIEESIFSNKDGRPLSFGLNGTARSEPA